MDYTFKGNSVERIGDCIRYSDSGTGLPVSNICELFVRFFGNSSDISLIANLLEVEIVAVVAEPYGKRSGFFMEHNDRSFDSCIISYAMKCISDPRDYSSLSYDTHDVARLFVPMYLNDKCIGYVLMGVFYVDECQSEHAHDFPVIPKSKIEFAVAKICKAGSKILEYCIKHISMNSSEQDTDFNAIFNYGNYYDLNLIDDTITMSKTTADVLGLEPGPGNTLQGFFNIIEESDRDRITDYLRSLVMLGGKDYKFVAPIVRPTDGRRAWIEVKGFVLKDDRAFPIRTLGFVQDITYLKNLQMRYQEESEAKTRLIRIIGHDLKNPFNGLIGFAELLCQSIEADRADEVKEYAQIIKTAAAEGYDLLVNLLDYSNSLSGTIKFNPVEFHLYDTVESILRLSSAQASRKSITLTNNVSRGIIITADEYKISTILRNLISNAIKFCYQDGSVEIRAEEIDEGMTKITVSDTGVEISEDSLRKINKAETVSSTIGTAAEKGTSIGLRLCNTFLNMHNSRLFANCADGTTTFGFII